MVTQRAVEEGQDDVEDASPGIELVAVLVPNPLPQNSKDPLPLGVPLQPRQTGHTVTEVKALSPNNSPDTTVCTMAKTVAQQP